MDFKYVFIKALPILAPVPLIDGASITSRVIIASVACVVLRSHSPLTQLNALSFSCIDMKPLPAHIKVELSLTPNEVDVRIRLALRPIKQ